MKQLVYLQSNGDKIEIRDARSLKLIEIVDEISDDKYDLISSPPGEPPGILVMSRDDIEQWEPEVPSLVVSITNPDKEDAIISDEVRGVLRLKFEDITFPVEDHIFFTPEMAGEIIDWLIWHVNNNPPFGQIVVHCEAGISRSSAIAAALTSGLYGEDDSYYFKVYAPNRWVYFMMLKALK